MLLFPGKGNGNVSAVIKSDGKIIKKIDLDKSREPYEFKIEGANGGYNIVRVENGKIAVIEADCPDLICVKRGFVSGGALPIVCLPHRLSISFEGGAAGADAVAGGQ